MIRTNQKIMMLVAVLVSVYTLTACVSVEDNDSNNNDTFNSSTNNATDTNNSTTNNGSSNNSANNATDTNNSTDTGWRPPENSLVYVSSATVLYVIDPQESLELQEIGPFEGPCTNDAGFYDLALDERGNLIGISEHGIYTIDKDTAHCADDFFHIPDGAPHFFSLSYVKGVLPDNPSKDCLMGASAEDGEWVMIDFSGEGLSDVFIHIGYYDSPDYKYVSSGDIVSVQTGPSSYKTYATLKCSRDYADPSDTNCDSDWLAEIDPTTGDARMIGQTGFHDIYGLGFWGDKVYGFTKEGEFILIDVNTGDATLVWQKESISFWGAGTTTKPYVVD